MSMFQWYVIHLYFLQIYIYIICYLDIDVSFCIRLHKHALDDLLHIWKKDLDDVPPNGSPILDWIPAPMAETQPFTKCSWPKSNAPSTHMLHTPPIAPPPIADDEPMDDTALSWAWMMNRALMMTWSMVRLSTAHLITTS